MDQEYQGMESEGRTRCRRSRARSKGAKHSAKEAGRGVRVQNTVQKRQGAE